MTSNNRIRRDKKILSFPVTYWDFSWSVGRKKNLLTRKNLPVILGKHLVLFHLFDN